MFRLIVVSLIFAIIVAAEVNYKGYKVYHVKPETLEHAKLLDILHYDEKFDFWEESRSLGDASDIMVAPEDQQQFEDVLKNAGLDFEIYVNDVQSLILEERRDRFLSRSGLSVGQVTFASFMTYNEQMTYLRRLAEDYPRIVTLHKLGESYEGRDILQLQISSGASNVLNPKPEIFIDAGIHCREWIATPVALYIIQQLVENPDMAYLLDNVDWFIIPNLNPDGHEFTWTNNRLWRKNRRLSPGNTCYGTDLNRNFGYQWMFAGASNNSCSDIYAGPEPFSEPESQIIRDWFENNDHHNVKLYLTFHSYGEMMLYPWGYDTVLPDNVEQLHEVGQLAADAIDSFSTINSRYQVNSSAILLYAAAGGSDDWVKAIGGVDLAYCVELPDGDAPFFFMIPARQILPAVQETFEGVKAYHQYVEETYWINQLN